MLDQHILNETEKQLKLKEHEETFYPQVTMILIQMKRHKDSIYK